MLTQKLCRIYKIRWAPLSYWSTFKWRRSTRTHMYTLWQLIACVSLVRLCCSVVWSDRCRSSRESIHWSAVHVSQQIVRQAGDPPPWWWVSLIIEVLKEKTEAPCRGRNSTSRHLRTHLCHIDSSGSHTACRPVLEISDQQALPSHQLIHWNNCTLSSSALSLCL